MQLVHLGTVFKLFELYNLIISAVFLVVHA